MAYGDKVLDITAEELVRAVKGFDNKADKSYVDSKTAFSLGVAGFYDENNVLIKSWDDLVSDGDVAVTDGVLSTAKITEKGTLIISDVVTGLSAGIFSGKNLLIGIKIPDTVTSIPSGAFYGTSLTSITIPDSVTSIGNAAFGNNKKLTSVTLGKGVIKISDAAFDVCSALTDVYYRSSKTDFDKIEIGTSNEYLTNATIHYSLTDEVYDKIDTKADKSYVSQNCSNAVKGTGTGTALLFNDVSPIEHKVDLSTVLEQSGTLLDWSNVSLSGTSITVSGSSKGYSSASTFDTSNDGWVSYTSTEKGKESLYFWGFPTDYSSHKGFRFKAYCKTSGVTMKYGNQNNEALQKSVLLPTSAPSDYYYIDTAFLGENFGDITFYVDTKNVTVYLSDIEWYDTPPTAKIYGKNLYKLSESESGNGFTFSDSNCKIENPTSYYYTLNSTEKIKLPKGTYTLSANVSGSIDYGSATRFYFYFHHGDTSSLHITKSDFESGKRTFTSKFTATEDFEFYIVSVTFDGRTPTSADLSINFQLEVGDTATEFEECQAQTITLDGNAQVDSVSPNMVVVADGEITVTYNRDTNKVINQLLIDNENLKNAITALGGTV